MSGSLRQSSKVTHIFAAIAFVALLCPYAGVSNAQYRGPVYKANVPKAKATSLRAIIEAIQLNYKVTQMLVSGSDNVQEMSRMLNRSYRIQQDAVGPIEGIQDPGLIYAIKLINEVGKPGTENAGGAIQNGDSEAALGYLEKVRKAHQQIMAILH